MPPDNPRRCTGTRTNGKPCTTLLPLIKVAEDPWPGVTDRCQYHEDGIELRSKLIADIALESCATDWDLLADTDARIAETEKKLAEKRKLGSLTQSRFAWDAVGPTAQQFSHDFEPGKTARMLAAGYKIWSQEEAS